MNRGGASAGGVAIVLAALASAAAAQPAMPTIGPQGGMERRVNVDLQARALYDSAVTRANPLGPAAGPLRQWDVLYAPNAALDIVMPIGRAYTYAQGNVGYEFYQRNPKLSRDRINVLAGAGTRFGPCNPEVVAGWAQGQSRVEDLTLGVTENEQETRTATLQVRCASEAGFIATASATYSEVDNTAVRGVVDNEALGFNGSLGYTNQALGSIQLIAQYYRTDYIYENPSPGVPLTPGVDVANFGLQYERPFGRRLLGRAGVGYSIIKTRAAAAGDNNALTADVGLTYTPSSRVSALFTYRRNASSTLIEGVDYVLLDTAQIELTYRFSPRLDGRLGAGWSDRRYKGQIDPRLVGAASREEVVRGTAGVALRVGRRSTISLDAEYQDRQTDVPELTFDAVRAGVTVSTSF